MTRNPWKRGTLAGDEQKHRTGFSSCGPHISGAAIATPEVDAWFEREVLPLEGALMQFLQHNWRNGSEVTDLRQDIYVRVYESALQS